MKLPIIGVMRSVSEHFAATPGRRGLVIGVLPARADDPQCTPKPGYPNPYVEIVIRTHLPLSGDEGTAMMSRNHINVLSSDAIVVLPGSAGTVSEARLAQRYGRPIIGFLETDEMRTLSDIERSASIDDVLTFVRRITARPGTP